MALQMCRIQSIGIRPLVRAKPLSLAALPRISVNRASVRRPAACNALLPGAEGFFMTAAAATPMPLADSSSSFADAALPSSAAAVAAMGAAPQPLSQLAEGLETPIQLIYLLTLLGFLSVGAYLVVRQVLIRRELDEAAKALGERIRTGQASCEDYYELGVILTRKKLYTQATKNLEKAKRVWDGDEAELAQVHNALGFCYFQMAKYDQAIPEYEKAVELQAGYVTAWNNLGDAYEATKQWRKALEAYQTVLQYAPNNKVASSRGEMCKNKVERLGL